MSLELAIKALVDKINSIGGSGIRAAPYYPEGDMAVAPFCLVRPDSGEITENAPREMKTLHNIVVEIAIPINAGTSRAVEQAMPFIESIPGAIMDALYDDQWGGSIDTFRSISYRFGGFSIADVSYIGWTFTINGVKIRKGY